MSNPSCRRLDTCAKREDILTGDATYSSQETRQRLYLAQDAKADALITQCEAKTQDKWVQTSGPSTGTVIPLSSSHSSPLSATPTGALTKQKPLPPLRRWNPLRRKRYSKIIPLTDELGDSLPSLPGSVPWLKFIILFK